MLTSQWCIPTDNGLAFSKSKRETQWKGKDTHHLVLPSLSDPADVVIVLLLH